MQVQLANCRGSWLWMEYTSSVSITNISRASWWKLF